MSGLGRRPSWWLGLGVLVIAGGVGISYLIEHSHYGSGSFVRFSFQQPPFVRRGQPPALRFDLPPGWRVKYNGKQRWCGGSVVDDQGRPRMEVWLFAGSSQPQSGAERVTSRRLPVGPVTLYRLGRTRDSSPFLSFPFATSGNVEVIELEVLFARGELMFTVRAEEEAGLTEVVWQCMETLRYEGE